MSDLIDEVRVRWPGWFGEPAPEQFSRAFIARPSASPRRGVLLVGAEGRRTFAAVLKVALEPSSNIALAREAARMQEVAALLAQQGLPTLIPPVLDHFEWDGAQIVVQEFRPGSPVEVPLRRASGSWSNRPITQYMNAVRAVSHSLARLSPGSVRPASEMFERFASHASQAGEREVVSHALDLAQFPLEFPVGWQHGDPAPGNLLVHRKQLTVIDWEMARPDFPTFFDMAYAYLSLFMMGARDSAAVAADVLKALAGAPPQGQRRLLPAFDLRGPAEAERDRMALTVTACMATLRAEDMGRAGPDSIWWPVAVDLLASSVKQLNKTPR